MRRLLDRDIYDEFGGWRIAAVGPQEIIGFDRKLREKGLSESGAANVMKPLRGLLDHGVLCGDIAVSPYRQLPRGKVSSCNTKRRHHEWTSEQAALFVATAYEFDRRPTSRRSYALQVETMVALGLRLAEVSGVQPRDIETEEVDGEECHVLHIRRQFSKRGEVHDYTKTESSQRRVPLTKDLHDKLRFRQSYLGLAETDFLFAAEAGGRPPAHSNFRRRAWHPIVAATGLQFDPDVRVVPHTARHMTASQLGALRLDSEDAAALLGHSSAKVTESIYTHVWDRDKREQRIRAAMAKAQNGGTS
jgi:integrase